MSEDQLRPLARPHPTIPGETVVNATAMIELARRVDSPRSRAFLRAYHAAEADLARDEPLLSEATRRMRAAIVAVEALGGRVSPEGGRG